VVEVVERKSGNEGTDGSREEVDPHGVKSVSDNGRTKGTSGVSVTTRRREHHEADSHVDKDCCNCDCGCGWSGRMRGRGRGRGRGRVIE